MAGHLTGAPAAARGALGTGSVLYLATQIPVEFAGMALIALVALSALSARSVRLASGGLARVQRAIDIDPARALLIVAVLAIFVLLQGLVLPNKFKPLTSAHLAVYLVVALARRDRTPSWPAARLVRWVSVLNAALLSSVFVPGLSEVLWYENLGQMRYRSVYFEPSIAALVYALNIVILWFAGERGSRDFPYIACNLACLALTYSGSGLLLLGAVALFQLRWSRIGGLWKYLVVLAPAGLLWLSSEGGQAAIQQLIVDRAAGIVALEYDNSVHLRAIAPLLFLDVVADAGVHAWLGAGVGGVESFMTQRQNDLWFMIDFKGDPVFEINNGYVVVIAAFGIPVAGVLIAAWLVHVARADSPRALKAYVLLYPLVSGFVIHPLLWLLIVMIGSRTGHRPARLKRIPCASPS